MWTKLIGTVILCLPIPIVILILCGISYADSSGVFTDEIEHWEYSSIEQKARECGVILDGEFDDTVITRTEYNRIIRRYDKMDKERNIIRAKVDLILTMKKLYH